MHTNIEASNDVIGIHACVCISISIYNNYIIYDIHTDVHKPVYVYTCIDVDMICLFFPTKKKHIMQHFEHIDMICLLYI